jgi:hypothetical protein
MTNAELITELRGHIREVPLTLLRDAADALESAEKRIAELETQLPKDGEWMPVGDGTIYVKCSVCGEEMCCRGRYCPNCGSVMKG